MNTQVDKNYYFSGNYDSLARFISYFFQLDLIRRSKPQSILFVGVGNALVSDYLKKQFGDQNVITLDIDPELQPDLVGDIKSLPLTDQSFDTVASFEVLEHLPFSQSERALGELARVSRKHVIISVPHRRVGLEVIFKFPYIRSLLKREFIRLTAFLPTRFPGFASSGQHYWEIDGRGTRLKDLRTALKKHFTIVSEHTPPLDCYHRFFVLEKI